MDPLPEDASSSNEGRPQAAGAPLRTADANAIAIRVKEHLLDAIVGRDDVVELVIIALLSGGHVLLEDYPGSGKTVLARALGQAIEAGPERDVIAPFRRIQFTPDLLPSDITGASVFDPESNAFSFRPGPVFAHVVLADEINRTSPKVQSALLEAMAERQVTVDNVTHRLDDLFLVVATQNPLGLAGTFPLPAPQLDRFLFKIRMQHIDRESELQVLSSFRKRLRMAPPALPRVSRDDLLAARRAIEERCVVSAAIQACLVDIARAARGDHRVGQGLSTRALVQSIPALQSRAVLHGREFVSTEDIESLLEPLFAHRLALAPGITDPLPVLREAAIAPLEAVSRGTLRR